MKKTLIVIIVLIIGTKIPLSAQTKPEPMDSYSIIKRNGGPFGFRFIEYNKGKNNTGGIHHNLICKGWGFSSSPKDFVKSLDKSKTYEELINEVVKEIIDYCILFSNNKKCKGEHTIKIPMPNLNDTNNLNYLTYRIKWKIENDISKIQNDILTEINNTDE